MRSDRESVVAVLDRLDAAIDDLTELSFEALTTPERLRVLERLERVARRLPAAQHALINQIGEQSSEEELGGRLPLALASWLRITRAEASRRVSEAADLGQRCALTGEPLAPQLSAAADLQRDGRIGAGHVRIIEISFATCYLGWTSRRAKEPKPIWPGWPPSSAPTN
ncbi:hypothetical protein MGAST_22580 [Mycobacterium gastri 'Wayne']|nr:hypothetical protein MGAST_22580 [Mycobacterium gastri 'Wayne']